MSSFLISYIYLSLPKDNTPTSYTARPALTTRLSPGAIVTTGINMSNPSQKPSAAAAGEQWDEAKVEAALKSLKDLHIQA